VKPAPRRAVTKTLTGVLVAAVDADKKTLRLQPSTGEAVTILLRDDSAFTKKGKTTAGSAGDFAAGDKVVARVSERPDGETWLRELRDAGSQADYERDRQGVTVGAVAANAKEKIEVRRADGSVAVFGITRGTVVRKNGASVRLDEFPAGSPVAVKPRAAFGKLNAAIIADTLNEVNATHADTLSRWRGVVQSVDADKNLLTLKREGDDAVRIVALSPTVSIKKARAQAPLTLKDVALGAFVEMRFAKGTNDARQRTAEEIRITTPRKPAPAPAAAPTGEKP